MSLEEELNNIRRRIKRLKIQILLEEAEESEHLQEVLKSLTLVELAIQVEIMNENKNHKAAILGYDLYLN